MEPTELQRAVATFVQALVRDRGLDAAAHYLRELAHALDRLAGLRSRECTRRPEKPPKH